MLSIYSHPKFCRLVKGFWHFYFAFCRWQRISFSVVSGSIMLFHNGNYIEFVEKEALIDKAGKLAIASADIPFEVSRWHYGDASCRFCNRHSWLLTTMSKKAFEYSVEKGENAGILVKYQGHTFRKKKWPLRGHRCFTNTSCFYLAFKDIFKNLLLLNSPFDFN